MNNQELKPGTYTVLKPTSFSMESPQDMRKIPAKYVVEGDLFDVIGPASKEGFSEIRDNGGRYEVLTADLLSALKNECVRFTASLLKGANRGPEHMLEPEPPKH